MAWESGLVERLRNGETVSFRPHGNSMVPMIKSGQLVTVAPLTVFGEEAGRVVDGVQVCVHKGDAVFCKVGGRLMLHKVTAQRAGQYQISNNSGHVNGWTVSKNLFGVLIRVEA